MSNDKNISERTIDGILTLSVRKGWRGDSADGNELDFFIGEFNIGIIKESDIEKPMEDGDRYIIPIKVYDALNEEPFDERLYVEAERFDEEDENERLELILELVEEQYAYRWMEVFYALRQK